MGKAIGMAEYKTVSAGIFGADAMVKTADIEVVEAETVCPGKYIVIVTGELSAVAAAVETAKHTREEELIDTFVLGNPDPSIFPAIYGATFVKELNSLGIIETYDAAAIIVAADTAAKTADVSLIEIRLARGMCGKSYVMITGEVAAVQAAIDRAKSAVAPRGMFLDSCVIARPDSRITKHIL